MKHALTTLGILTVFALGAGAMTRVIATAPAFNAELRRDSAFGDTVVLLGRDMYQHPAYLYQQAASFVRADLIPLSAEGEDPVVVPVEVAAARAAEAVVLSRESLALDPGNAGAWVVLAWAHLMTGAPEPALEALRASWQLAPYSYALAPERVALSLTLFDPDLRRADHQPTLAEDVHRGILQDFETLWKQRRNVHRLYAEEARDLGLPVHPRPPGS